jgi:tRNA (adenine22-N1)-methyltransferase
VSNRSLTPRLALAASLVRRGAYLADIGTDHAYLAIELLRSGKIERAVLSDINRGPLSRAEENAREAGVLDRAELVLSDGASHLDGYPVTDVAVLGMGGELIAAIISAAPYLNREGVRLILGPMTRPEALRRALFEGGFSIDEEHYVFDSGRYYLTLVATYSGKRYEYSEADAAFGRAEHFQSVTPDMLGYMRVRLSALEAVVRGKAQSADGAEAERALIKTLIERLEGKL